VGHGTRLRYSTVRTNETTPAVTLQASTPPTAHASGGLAEQSTLNEGWTFAAQWRDGNLSFASGSCGHGREPWLLALPPHLPRRTPEPSGPTSSHIMRPMARSLISANGRVISGRVLPFTVLAAVQNPQPTCLPCTLSTQATPYYVQQQRSSFLSAANDNQHRFFFTGVGPPSSTSRSYVGSPRTFASSHRSSSPRELSIALRLFIPNLLTLPLLPGACPRLVISSCTSGSFEFHGVKASTATVALRILDTAIDLVRNHYIGLAVGISNLRPCSPALALA
jgi:hypothetical protein